MVVWWFIGGGRWLFGGCSCCQKSWGRNGKEKWREEWDCEIIEVSTSMMLCMYEMNEAWGGMGNKKWQIFGGPTRNGEFSSCLPNCVTCCGRLPVNFVIHLNVKTFIRRVMLTIILR